MARPIVDPTWKDLGGSNRFVKSCHVSRCFANKTGALTDPFQRMSVKDLWAPLSFTFSHPAMNLSFQTVRIVFLHLSLGPNLPVWYATVGRLDHLYCFRLEHAWKLQCECDVEPDLPFLCAQVPFPSSPWTEDKLGFHWWAVHLFLDCVRLVVSWCVTWCAPILLQQP